MKKYCKKCKTSHHIDDFVSITSNNNITKKYCKISIEQNSYKNIPYSFLKKYCSFHKKVFPIDHFIDVKFKTKTIKACKENYYNNGGKVLKNNGSRKYNKPLKYGYKKGTKEWERSIWLMRTYGLTLTEYDKLLNKQNNCCAICKINKNNFKKNLCVDHCHITGKVRGLLCTKCNKSIGLFKDNIEIINSAINYVTRMHKM